MWMEGTLVRKGVVGMRHRVDRRRRGRSRGAQLLGNTFTKSSLARNCRRNCRRSSGEGLQEVAAGQWRGDVVPGDGHHRRVAGQTVRNHVTPDDSRGIWRLNFFCHFETRARRKIVQTHVQVACDLARRTGGCARAVAVICFHLWRRSLPLRERRPR